MANRSIKLECVETKRAVAVYDNDLLVGLGDLCTNSERQSDTHSAKWSGIESMARCKGRHGLAAEVQDFLPVDHQYGVALHKTLDLVAQSQRMDRRLVHRLVGARRLALCYLAVGQRSPPCGEMIRIDALSARLDELTEHRLAVADDTDIDIARRGRDFVDIDIDARYLGASVETGRCRMADDVIHTGADHDNQVGVTKGRGAHGHIRIFMIVRHDATALRCSVEWNAGPFEELLQFMRSLRPDHATAGQYDRSTRLGDRVDQCIDFFGITQRSRV